MSDPQVRVRFAPSPTGYLHVGGARTALFNWLLARKHGGKLILRIEDTDQKREVGDSLPKILDDLRWLGLDWDEGPEVGGDAGPYSQSERLEHYNRYCRQLLDAGHAYYAFDTPEELTALREEAKRDKRTFKYPRPATFPTHDDAQRAKTEGKPAVVRLKMPDHGSITVHDVIVGDMVLQHVEMEDFIIQKADGFPTYHFACVVDDELMNITHVLRGQEHLINTVKHIALQQALGMRTPIYAHLPIIFNMSGSKMSKRDKAKAIAKGEPPPEIDVHDFRLAGYLPETLLNFIALLGWSPGQDREKMTLDEMVQLFSLDRISKTSAKFDRAKLLAFNTDASAEAEPDRLLTGMRDFLNKRSEPPPPLPDFMDRTESDKLDERLRQYYTPKDHPMRLADDATLRKVLEVCKGFRTFADVVSKAGFLFIDDDAIEYDPKAVKKVLEKNDGEGYAMLEKLLPEFEKLDDWTPDSLTKLLEAKQKELNVGFGKIAQPLRVALTGTTVSPQIVDTLLLLGRARTVARGKLLRAAPRPSNHGSLRRHDTL